MHLCLQHINSVSTLQLINKVIDFGYFFFGGRDHQVWVVIYIVQLVELLFDVEGLLEDGDHLGEFLEVIEVLDENSERLNHDLLSQNHHLFHFKFPTEDHVPDGCVDVVFQEVFLKFFGSEHRLQTGKGSCKLQPGIGLHNIGQILLFVVASNHVDPIKVGLEGFLVEGVLFDQLQCFF